MVTMYNRKDLVSFGNYLLSDERNKLVSEENRGSVTHADVENWIASRMKSKWLSITEDDVPEDKREAFRTLKPTMDSLLGVMDEAISNPSDVKTIKVQRIEDLYRTMQFDGFRFDGLRVDCEMTLTSQKQVELLIDTLLVSKEGLPK